MDATGKFLKEAGRYPLLTHEQEIELGTIVQRWRSRLVQYNEVAERGETPLPIDPQIIDRGIAARNKLVNHNLKFVVRVARIYVAKKQLDPIDLYHEGVIGLTAAAEKFDPARGNRFCTCAGWWVRQSMARALIRTGGTIRIADTMHERIQKLQKICREYRASTGAHPSREQMAKLMDASVERIDELLKYSDLRYINSLNSRIVLAGKEAAELGDLIPDPKTLNEGYDWSDYERIWEAVEHLPTRQQQVIKARYGGESTRPLSMAKCGQILQIAPETVRYQENVAISRLKAILDPEPLVG